ncbi:helix-turn-helix domain-containing protein [Nitrosomonas nitrosa]|jgi:transposase|uniref:helix-turn-helix domain-containing protein n=1 Tax=Nitrosomonas nitrosa TaxID=52442 RepID=UPI003C6E8AAE
MLTQELLVEIHVLHRHGKSIRAIAKTFQLSRNSVRKYLRNNAMAPSYSKRSDRVSKLYLFKV